MIVGPTSVTGIGSTLFEVKDFKITRPGYGFREGDVIKPVGMVTDRGIAAMTDFELTITDVFNDSFAAWQFGELITLTLSRFIKMELELASLSSTEVN